MQLAFIRLPTKHGIDIYSSKIMPHYRLYKRVLEESNFSIVIQYKHDDEEFHISTILTHLDAHSIIKDPSLHIEINSNSSSKLFELIDTFYTDKYNISIEDHPIFIKFKTLWCKIKTSETHTSNISRYFDAQAVKKLEDMNIQRFWENTYQQLDNEDPRLIEDDITGKLEKIMELYNSVQSDQKHNIRLKMQEEDEKRKISEDKKLKAEELQRKYREAQIKQEQLRQEQEQDKKRSEIQKREQDQAESLRKIQDEKNRSDELARVKEEKIQRAREESARIKENLAIKKINETKIPGFSTPINHIDNALKNVELETKKLALEIKRQEILASLKAKQEQEALAKSKANSSLNNVEQKKLANLQKIEEMRRLKSQGGQTKPAEVAVVVDDELELKKLENLKKIEEFKIKRNEALALKNQRDLEKQQEAEAKKKQATDQILRNKERIKRMELERQEEEKLRETATLAAKKSTRENSIISQVPEHKDNIKEEERKQRIEAERQKEEFERAEAIRVAELTAKTMADTIQSTTKPTTKTTNLSSKQLEAMERRIKEEKSKEDKQRAEAQALAEVKSKKMAATIALTKSQEPKAVSSSVTEDELKTIGINNPDMVITPIPDLDPSLKNKLDDLTSLPPIVGEPIPALPSPEVVDTKKKIVKKIVKKSSLKTPSLKVGESVSELTYN